MNEFQTNLQECAGRYLVVAIAASAGGLGAITAVLGDLPASFPAAILIVQHLDPRHRSLMADILTRKTALNVKQAEAGDDLQPGTVLIAPPNYHMLVNMRGHIELTQTELVHFVRPSADLLFESVAGTYRDRAIAVVLTGTGIDGSLGVEAVHKTGGTVIVQDPDSADFDGMPRAAINTKCVDFVLPLEDIPAALQKLLEA